MNIYMMALDFVQKGGEENVCSSICPPHPRMSEYALMPEQTPPVFCVNLCVNECDRLYVQDVVTVPTLNLQFTHRHLHSKLSNICMHHLHASHFIEDSEGSL